MDSHYALFDLVKGVARGREKLEHQNSFSKGRRDCTALFSAQPVYFLHPASKPDTSGLCQQTVQSVQCAQQEGRAAWVIQQGCTGHKAHQQQAGRVLGEGEGWKFAEGRGFASNKFF